MENEVAVLRRLDAEAARAGSSRAVGAQAKIVANLVGSPAAVACGCFSSKKWTLLS